jgi:cyclase
VLQARLIPALLLRNGGLVKTVGFKNPTYVGDPINAVRIFNEKEVDEVVFLDIAATKTGKGPNFDLLADIASEAFMPFGYGGGVTSLDQVKRLLALGIEKIILNTVVAENPTFVEAAMRVAGSSSVVVSIDVRRTFLGKNAVYVRGGVQPTGKDPVQYAKEIERLGAGEVLLQSVDRDGTQMGYDLALVRAVSESVAIPVVAIGGAGSLQHFREAVQAGASAATAGSYFLFHGKHRAVLISYPEHGEIRQLFTS